MTSMTTKSRSAFLDKASQLLATASPAVSAELQSTRRDFQDEPQAVLTSQKGTFACIACGSLLIPGWNCKSLSNAQKPRRTRQDRLAKKTNTKSLRLQCSLCNSITTFESRKPSARQLGKVSKGTVIPEPVVKEQRTPLPAAPTVESEQSGSKKRARNKKSSLQSMLADKKSTEQKKGPGLGLMDFMKT